MLIRALSAAAVTFGVGAVLFGIAVIYWPAALIVGGLLFGAAGLLADDGKSTQ